MSHPLDGEAEVQIHPIHDVHLTEPLGGGQQNAGSTVALADSALRGVVTDEMVSRFLCWKLPADFSPDAGITFKRVYNEQSPFGPQNREPVGTNLLTAIQARAMLEHVLGPATGTPAEEFRQRLGAIFHIGAMARTDEVILINAENASRRAACLSAVEYEFFTNKRGDSMLNWGSDRAEYVEQMRAALAAFVSAEFDTGFTPEALGSDDPKN